MFINYLFNKNLINKMKAILFFFLFTAVFSLQIEGIDVSSYQGTIDWPTVAKTKHFAILRAGTGYNGGNNKDSKFEENYKNAKAAGVKVGAYWYSYAKSVDDAKKEAKYFLQHLKGKKFEWPVYYDIEESSQFSSGIHNAIAKAFCEILEGEKYYCGIYASGSRWSSNFDNVVRTKYTVWIAHWGVKSPSYTGTYHVWQKTSDGSVSGIKGRVDLDVSYVNFEPTMKSKSLNGY